MTIAALPAPQRRCSSPPAARRSRNAMSPRPPQTLSRRRAHTHRPYLRPRKSSSSRQWLSRTTAKREELEQARVGQFERKFSVAGEA